MNSKKREKKLRLFESRPARYDSATEAERMTEFRNAYAICELAGAPPWPSEVERLFRLLASGRISEKQYMQLTLSVDMGVRGLMAPRGAP